MSTFFACGPAILCDVKWERPHPENYTIAIAWNPQARLYTGTWRPGAKDTIVRSGSSLAYVLREIANQLEHSGKYGSDEELITDPKAFKKDTDCKYCSAPILFAVVPPNNKHLAFDAVPIQAEQCRGTRVARFGATMVSSNGRNNKNSLRAIWLGPQTTGPAWIPHPETCGVKTDTPMSPGVKARWQENHSRQYSPEVREQFQVEPEKTFDVIAGLKAIALDAKKVKERVQDDLN